MQFKFSPLVKDTIRDILPFPIQATDKKMDKEIVYLVETMLQLQKEKQQTNIANKLIQLDARIKYTDEKTNQLVFELNGLSEAEVRVVERE